MINNLLEILTVGLPFCAFKIITGLFFDQHWLTAIGLIDLVINLMNLLSLVFLKKRIFDACFLSFITRSLKKPKPQAKPLWQDLGNSLDVLISFTLVAFMIGGGFIPLMPANHLSIWNMAVILNVFGAGYGRFMGSLHNLKS
jgi:hypothetical protein